MCQKILCLCMLAPCMAMTMEKKDACAEEHEHMLTALKPTKNDLAVLMFLKSKIYGNNEQCGVCLENGCVDEMVSWHWSHEGHYAHKACAELIAPVEHDAVEKLGQFFSDAHDRPSFERAHEFVVDKVNRACGYWAGPMKFRLDQGQTQDLKELFDGAAEALLVCLKDLSTLDRK